MPEKSQQQNCLNCEAPIAGKFCPNCGQRTSIQPLSLKVIFQEIPQALFNFERRYWYTIRDFFINPKRMVSSYAQGKRRHYAPPIQFFFFFATISLLLGLIINDEPVSSLNASLDVNNESPAFLQRMQAAIKYIVMLSTNYSNYFELGIPVFLGFGTRLLFRKRISLAEAMVFSFLSLGITLELVMFLFIPFGQNATTGSAVGITIFLLMGYFYSFLGKYKILSVLLGLFSVIVAFALYVVTLWIVLALILDFLPELQSA